jgi:hypothetical protein
VEIRTLASCVPDRGLALGGLAAGQAITFAWLSAFPERAAQLDSLAIKFWSYAAVSVVLMVIDLGLLVRLVRQIKDRRRRSSVANEGEAK